MYKVIVSAAGCARSTAASYAGRASLEPLVIEGLEAGGQLTLTTDVENYPGFPEGIMGPDLVDRMKQQAQRFGATYRHGAVTRADLSSRPFKLWIGDEQCAEGGIPHPGYSEETAIEHLLGDEIELRVDVGVGDGEATIWTCDLTHGYIDINAGYRT